MTILCQGSAKPANPSGACEGVKAQGPNALGVVAVDGVAHCLFVCLKVSYRVRGALRAAGVPVPALPQTAQRVSVRHRSLPIRAGTLQTQSAGLGGRERRAWVVCCCGYSTGSPRSIAVGDVPDSPLSLGSVVCLITDADRFQTLGAGVVSPLAGGRIAVAVFPDLVCGFQSHCVCVHAPIISTGSDGLGSRVCHLSDCPLVSRPEYKELKGELVIPCGLIVPNCVSQSQVELSDICLMLPQQFLQGNTTCRDSWCACEHRRKRTYILSLSPQ